jgi:hypothetical protein
MSTTVRIATRVTPPARVAVKNGNDRQGLLHAAVVVCLVLLASGVIACPRKP